MKGGGGRPKLEERAQKWGWGESQSLLGGGLWGGFGAFWVSPGSGREAERSPVSFCSWISFRAKMEVAAERGGGGWGGGKALSSAPPCWPLAAAPFFPPDGSEIRLSVIQRFLSSFIHKFRPFIRSFIPCFLHSFTRPFIPCPPIMRPRPK